MLREMLFPVAEAGADRPAGGRGTPDIGRGVTGRSAFVAPPRFMFGWTMGLAS